MKKFIVHVSIGYYLWAEFLAQLYQMLVPSSAEFTTAPTVWQPESHALSFQNNLLMQILFC